MSNTTSPFSLLSNTLCRADVSHKLTGLPSSHSSLTRTLLAAACTLTLVACGGGSDSSSTTSPNTPGTGSIPIQTTVPEPPPTLGTGKRLALDYMNRQRLQCGFGALRYNPILETAGNRHAAYDQANKDHPLYHPHNEIKGLPGFTAPSPTERAVVAGYVTNGAEVGEIGATRGQVSAPVQTYRAMPLDQLETVDLRNLAIAPYHAMAFFSAFTEVGIGEMRTETALAAEWITLNGLTLFRPESIRMDRSLFAILGYGKDGQGQLSPPGSGVRTYPCEGSTDVAPILSGEWTDPALGPGVTPGRDLGAYPTGSTIMVIGEVGKKLALQSVSLTRVATGESVPMYSVRTMANDPMPVYYRNDWTGYAMPDKALAFNERYQVTISGTSGGTPFSRSFTFTTGGPNPLVPGV